MRETPAPTMMTSGAFADLLNRFQWSLYAFLRGFVADNEQARDLVQDVFCDAWRAVQRAAAPFDGQSDEDYIRRWLFNTAYCRAISLLRRRRLIHWESLEKLNEQQDTTPLLTLPFEDTVLEAAALQATFATMPTESVAVLLLSIVHGFTTTEIAEIIGISHEATKKRLARAKRRLRIEYLARNPQMQEASRQ